MADSVEDIQKATKTYLAIFGALLVGTILTVAVATVHWLDFGKHGFDWPDAVLGLAIASCKASLVGYYFMHLNHEKKAVYWIFFGSFVFCAFLFALVALAKGNPIFDQFFYN